MKLVNKKHVYLDDEALAIVERVATERGVPFIVALRAIIREHGQAPELPVLPEPRVVNWCQPGY